MKEFNPPNSTECGNGLCVYELIKIYPHDEKIISLTHIPRDILALSFKFFNYSERNNVERLLFNPENQEYKPFVVSPTGSELASLVGNISYGSTPAVLISKNNKYQSICGPSKPSTCTEPCICTHVYNLPLQVIVDIILYDEGPLPNLNHPFHLHGYSFCVLYSGQFSDALNKDVITNMDVIKEMNAHMTRLQNGSYKHCAPKDTVIVPNTGFVILRFMTVNPGWWFFHCHFAWHIASGMNVVIHVGNPRDLPPVPRGFPECYNWTPKIF